jgi:hypothetical protein
MKRVLMKLWVGTSILSRCSYMQWAVAPRKLSQFDHIGFLAHLRGAYAITWRPLARHVL